MNDQICEVRFKAANKGRAVTTLGDLAPGRTRGIQVVLIRREDNLNDPITDFELADGDLLVVVGREAAVDAWMHDETCIELDGKPEMQTNFGASSAELVEVMIPPHSSDIGKTAREISLRDMHGLIAIALWRDGKPRYDYVREEVLQAGDALLLYGDKRNTRGFDDSEAGLFWLQEPSQTEAPRALRHLGKWVALIFIAVVLAQVQFPAKKAKQLQ